MFKTTIYKTIENNLIDLTKKSRFESDIFVHLH